MWPLRSAFILVDHEELSPDTTYRGVEVHYEGEEARFATGDPEADFKAGLAWGVAKAGHVIYSSTVDNFVMDSSVWEYAEDNTLRRR